MSDQATPVAEERSIRVYSRFQHRTLIHGAHRAAPNTFATVPESVAQRWMEQFPDDIVEAGIAQKELGGVAAELAETRTKLAAAEARIKELEAKVSGKPMKPAKASDAI